MKGDDHILSAYWLDAGIAASYQVSVLLKRK